MRKALLLLALTAIVGPSPSAQTRNFSVPVEYRKLPNGLRVVISENHAAPVVMVEVMYRIGFRIEPKDRTGFAHLFEHMMFQGSEHVAKFEHVRIVNENGGTLNGSTRFVVRVASGSVFFALRMVTTDSRSTCIGLRPCNVRNTG